MLTICEYIIKPYSITDPKRKRCSIELCEGYCDDTTISVTCESCCIENRSLRFCSMHVPHVSHSGQLGFLEQPLAIALVPPPASEHQESQVHVNVTSDNSSSAAAISIGEIETVVMSMEEEGVVLVETTAPPLADTSVSSALFQSQTETESSFNSDAAGQQHLTTGSSSFTTDLSSTEKKIVRLFEEGFQQSSKTNISPQMKVLGALNHACYKKHLGIIVAHFNLSSVAIPTITALGNNAVREKFLNEVVNAYEETRKGKIGV